MSMSERIDWDALPYALGAIGLGIVTIIVRDFALQWQPVPVGIPAHAFLALVSGAILIIGGGASLWRDAGKARLILPLFYGLWVVALHLPHFVAHPGVAALLGGAEVLSLATAGAAVARTGYDGIAVRMLGVSAIIFGISHFAYVSVTAGMVPAWVPPNGVFWAYATGVAHFTAGAAIISGLLRRLAATMLAAMCGLFTLLVWLPPLLKNTESRVQWTMFLVSLSIAGAAWLISRIAEDDVRLMRFIGGLVRGSGRAGAGRKPG